MKTRKILSLILVIMLVVFPFDVSATGNDLIDDLSIIDQEGESISPLYEPVCGTYPSHRMVAKGFGTVYRDSERYLFLQCAWQCSRCYLVMVTDGDLYYWGMEPIGKYAIFYADREISDETTVIIDAHYYGYTSNNYLSGYKFYLAQ